MSEDLSATKDCQTASKVLKAGSSCLAVLPRPHSAADIFFLTVGCQPIHVAAGPGATISIRQGDPH